MHTSEDLGEGLCEHPYIEGNSPIRHVCLQATCIPAQCNKTVIVREDIGDHAGKVQRTGQVAEAERAARAQAHDLREAPLRLLAPLELLQADAHARERVRVQRPRLHRLLQAGHGRRGGSDECELFITLHFLLIRSHRDLSGCFFGSPPSAPATTYGISTRAFLALLIGL